MADFDSDVFSIKIPRDTVRWGPHAFNFSGAIPDPVGDPLVDVTVKSFLNEEEGTDALTRV
jgi:hypothetical protein